MTRCVLPHVLRRVPGRGQGARAPPPRVGAAHLRAADASWPAWPSSPASPTCPTPASSFVPERIALQFEHYVEPTGAAYFPRSTTTSTSRSPWRSSPRRSPSSASGWRTSTGSRARLPGRHRAATGAGHGRLHAPREQVLLRRPLHGRHRRGIKGPIARAAYWFNQNVIDGVVNGVGSRRQRRRRLHLHVVDQGVVDGVVNGSARRLGRVGPASCVDSRPARSSSTAPCCSAAPSSWPAS